MPRVVGIPWARRGYKPGMTLMRAMTTYAAGDLGDALLLVGIVLVGICILAVITIYLVPSQSAAHKATTRRRARETRGRQAVGTHQLRR